MRLTESAKSRSQGMVAFLVLAASPAALAQRTDFVATGDTWRFFKGTTHPPIAWRTASFDDSTWTAGRSGFGYDDGAHGTVLADMKNGYVSLFVRKTFTVTSTALVKLTLRVNYDDGFVAYLNGAEIARRNVTGAPPAFNTSATSHEGGMYESIDVSAAIGLLVHGTNVLAIQGHNAGISSSDFALAPELSGEAGALQLVRGPYLQRSSSSGTRVRFSTNAACTGAVHYGPTPALGFTVNGGHATDHAIDLTDLDPAGEYYYRPACGGVALETAATAFRTFADDDSQPVTFGFLADSGAVTHPAGYQSAVARLIEGWDPDLVLHGGDVVYDAPAAGYEPQYFDVYRALNRSRTMFMGFGNHESDMDGGATWRQVFDTPANNPAGNEAYYSFDAGHVHFTVLSSEESTSSSSAQLAWLDADLAATTKPWKVVVIHRAIYSSGGNGNAADLIANVVPILERRGVDLVLSGNDHDYERSFPLVGGVPQTAEEPNYGDPAGPIYVVAGGGGHSVRTVGVSATTAYSESAFHAVRVDVDGATLVLRAYRWDGSQMDVQVSLDKTPSTDPPTAPAGLTALAAGANRIDLSWTDATGERSYRIERADATGPFAPLATAGAQATGYTDATCVSNTVYRYRVVAVNTVGETASDEAGDRTWMLMAPANVVANAASATQVNLSWRSSGASARYGVERSTDGGASWAHAGTTALGALSFADQGRAPGTTYHYRLYAFDTGSVSPYSAVVAATTPVTGPLAAPSNLTTVLYTNSEYKYVRIRWTDNATAESGFRIERAVGDGPFVQVATRGATSMTLVTWTDYSLTEATSYRYRVLAYGASGTSDYSNVASYDSWPRPPTSPSVSPQSNGTMRFGWYVRSTVAGAYELERAAASAGPWAPLATVAAGPPSRTQYYFDAAVTPGQTYCYRARAVAVTPTGATVRSAYTTAKCATR